MPVRLDLLSREDLDLTHVPKSLAIDMIDEDPDQPRREFDADALGELAETIKVRGIRQPVSVRPNPEQPGRFILNFGARRLRACKLAGETEIPAFIDVPVDAYDQVVENEQREALKPLELAAFVKRRLELGESQTDIARLLGKSQPYIAYVCALVDAPPWLLQVYMEGRCRGVTELYHLRRLHEQAPREVQTWALQQESITRSNVHLLKTRIAQAGKIPSSKAVFEEGESAGSRTVVGIPGCVVAEQTTSDSMGHVDSARRKQRLGAATKLEPPDAQFSAGPRSAAVEDQARDVRGLSSAVSTDAVTAILSRLEHLVSALKTSSAPNATELLARLQARLLELGRR